MMIHKSLLFSLFIITLDSAPIDVNQIKEDVNLLLNRNGTAEEIINSVLDYCNKMNEEQLDLFRTACLQTIDEEIGTIRFNLNNIDIMIQGYVNKKFTLKSQSVGEEIRSEIQKDCENFEKRGFDTIDIKDDRDKMLIRNYVFLHYLLRVYLPLTFDNDSYALCYETVLVSLDNLHVYIRELAATYLKKLICENKMVLIDKVELKQKVKKAIEKENQMANFENEDKISYKSLQETIINNLNDVLKSLGE